MMPVDSRVGVKGTMGESGRTGWVGEVGGVRCWMAERPEEKKEE